MEAAVAVSEERLHACTNKAQHRLAPHLALRSRPKHTAAEAGTGLARALYDYPAEHEGDLPFDPDDEIVLLEKIDDSWFRGSCKGKTGMFPKDFVGL